MVLGFLRLSHCFCDRLFFSAQQVWLAQSAAAFISLVVNGTLQRMMVVSFPPATSFLSVLRKSVGVSLANDCTPVGRTNSPERKSGSVQSERPPPGPGSPYAKH